MPKRYMCVKKLPFLTFGSVNYASTAGGYAAVTKGLNRRITPFEDPAGASLPR